MFKHTIVKQFVLLTLSFHYICWSINPCRNIQVFIFSLSFHIAVVNSCQLIHGNLTVRNTLLKRKFIHFATSEDQQSFSELEPDDSEQETLGSSAEDSPFTNISYDHTEGAVGKPGFISFYRPTQRKADEVFTSSPVKNQNKLLWVVGPTVLVASFVFPSLYLRRILSSIFEDSLLTGKLGSCYLSLLQEFKSLSMIVLLRILIFLTKEYFTTVT